MKLFLLKETTEDKIQKIKNELYYICKETLARFETFEKMPIQKYQSLYEEYDNSLKEIKKSCNYGAWLEKKEFLAGKLVMEAIKLLIDKKTTIIENEQLINKFTYYKDVKLNGDYISGYRCSFNETREPIWIPFNNKLVLEKVKTLLNFGDVNDFTKIYYEYADGIKNPIANVDWNHIKNSSDDSFKLMEEYCESRWSGKWAWELEQSEKLSAIIEEIEMDKLTLLKNREKLNEQVNLIMEEEHDKFSLISAIQDMNSRINAMIADIGKIASDSIELGVAAETDPTLGSPNIHQIVELPAGEVARSLASLKSAINMVLDKISTADGDNSNNDSMDDLDGIGMDDPAMMTGIDKQKSDELSDLSLDSDDGERIKKEI